MYSLNISQLVVSQFCEYVASNRVSQLGSTSEGDNFGKMAKNCMKITKSEFFGQSSGWWGGTWGDKPTFRVVGGGGPPTRGNPE